MRGTLVLLDDMIQRFEINGTAKRLIDYDYEKVSEFIEEKLRDISEENDFRVLFCAEKSSHVWGTSYIGSDNDVKAIIYYKPRFYYSPFREICSSWKVQYRPKDTSDDPDVELSFMEINKVCELIIKNDPNIFEIFSSPISYVIESEKLMERFKEIVYSLYDYRKMAKKYLGFAQTNYLALTKKGKKRKKAQKKPLKILFYVWRGLLSTEWLLNHGKCKGLPLNINDLIRQSKLMQKEDKQRLLRLLTTKFKKAKFDIDCEDSKRLIIDAEQTLEQMWSTVNVKEDNDDENEKLKKSKREQQIMQLEQLLFDVIESYK